MKPDDIPEDVWAAAVRCAEVVCRNLPEDYGDMTIEIRAIARVILAERERCAQLIERGVNRVVHQPFWVGRRSKNDLCPHERYMYEDCERCCADAIRAGAK